MTQRRAPVQGDYARGGRPPGTVPWDVHERAWRAYAAQFGDDQSAERIAERAGFSYQELQLLLTGRRLGLGASPAGLPGVPGWEPCS